MKTRTAVVVTLCIFAMATALAQTPGVSSEGEIEGAGTTNFVPLFTGSHRLGNSRIFQSSDGNIGIGTITPLFPVHIFRSNVVPPPGQSPTVFLVETSGSSDTDTFSAIQGLASSTTGGGVTAVLGTGYGPTSIAVFGNNTATTGGGGGVLGVTSSADFQFSYATRGDALANTGSAVAIFGQPYSPNGTAGYFLNRAGGNIIVGHVGQNDDQSVFRVDGTGAVYADGGFQPSGADFAESMAVTGDRNKYVAGDLLAIDPTAKRHLALAR
jgi:hypothetical protein